jgi:hypothetical protein
MSKVCTEDQRAYDKAYYAAHKEVIRAQKKIYYAERAEEKKAYGHIYRMGNVEARKTFQKAYYIKNKQTLLDKAGAYRVENRDEINTKKKSYYTKTKETRRPHMRAYHAKWRKIPKNKLNDNISTGISHSVTGGSKGNRHWESLVNFTIDQLKRHLEKLFTPEMSWENYGTYWHIDHKIPIAVFNFEKPEHIDFKLCWRLKNLQPLEAKENMSKGAKLDKHFQPSLAMGG